MIIFRIKELRNKKDISLYKLAKLTGISRRYLFELENGKKLNPTLDILCKISNVLKVNIKDLFYTKIDIEDLKLKMYDKIDYYGLNSP